MEWVLIPSWLVFACGVGYIADERGYSGVGWTALSIFLSPLLAVVVLLSKPNLVELAINQEREDRRHQEILAALAKRNASAQSTEGKMSNANAQSADGKMSSDDQTIMDQFGITYSLSRYHLDDRRFMELSDAVKYAKLKQGKS